MHPLFHIFPSSLLSIDMFVGTNNNVIKLALSSFMIHLDRGAQERILDFTL